MYSFGNLSVTNFKMISTVLNQNCTSTKIYLNMTSFVVRVSDLKSIC